MKSGQMTRRSLIAGLLPCWLMACAPVLPPVQAPVTGGSLETELMLAEPKAQPGHCWHQEMRPALFETVTEQELVSAEVRGEDGTVTSPAGFRSVTRQSELRPRQTVWFRTPCPEEMGRGDVFTASLQRALKARGLFGGTVTGEMTPETAEALRRHQAANGLDSPVLSLAVARRLGLVAVR